MRLDLYLVEKNLVKTRSEATDLIKNGFVLVNDKLITKAGFNILLTDEISLLKARKYVSRAGEKLEQALIKFNLDVNDKIIIDVGSSTGGFTDCCLKNNAKYVYAYEIGTNQMDLSLRESQKISLFEKTDFLKINIPLADLIVIDVSFTSIKPILNHTSKTNSQIIALIKPQFEANARNLNKNGVIKSDKINDRIIEELINYIKKDLHYKVCGLIKAELKGKKGNQEYLVYLKK